MSIVTIEDAKVRLAEIIEQLLPGEQIVITRDHKPIARLIAENEPVAQLPRKLGTLQGTVLYMAPDFDAPLDDFKEYME